MSNKTRFIVYPVGEEDRAPVYTILDIHRQQPRGMWILRPDAAGMRFPKWQWIMLPASGLISIATLASIIKDASIGIMHPLVIIAALIVWVISGLHLSVVWRARRLILASLIMWALDREGLPAIVGSKPPVPGIDEPTIVTMTKEDDDAQG